MTENQDFADRVAVITGGAGGIGRAIAIELIRSGAHVVIADIDDTALRQTAADIGAHPLTADVTDAVSMQALAEEVVARFGTVDILVNNAGIGVLGTLHDLALADFHRVMDVNFWGVLHGIMSFLPYLKASLHGGHIVNTSSMAGLLPARGLAAYATSKASVNALSEVLMAELTDEGVKVSVIVPGRVRTAISTNAGPSSTPADGQGESIPFVPRMRRLEPEDVGERIVHGMRTGQRYIVTHPELLSEVEARHSRLESAFAPAEPTAGRGG